MSKPRKKIRAKGSRESCERKQTFDTLEAADAAAYRPARTVAAWGFMRGYRCKFCKKFHYGHPAGFR